MKKILKVSCIFALAAVIGFSCYSSPYILAEAPEKPDGKNAVVIFVSDKYSKAQVWDGEKPIGTFDGTPGASVNCIFRKVTAGTHTLVARSTNIVHQKMNLQANKTYYIRIYTIPAPYVTPIAMADMTKQEFDDYTKIRTTKYMEFDDEWQKEILKDEKGLKEIKDYLKTAK